jgi:hypothetical protein
MKRIIAIWLFGCFILHPAYAQHTTNKVVGAKNETLIDSIKSIDYPYLLPIWGQKVAQQGFQLPKSGGLSVQYIWQESDIIIDNLNIGFNNGPLYNLDEIIRFNKSQTSTQGINVRPDFWLLPFLNVYFIYAQSNTATSINADLWIPNDTAWQKVTTFDTKAKFNATTMGFGLTPTIGIGGYFLALDMNFSWSDISELEKPAYAFVFGPRLGKNFSFKKPERSLAAWVGGFRVKLNTGTTGNLLLSDLFPINEWQKKIDTGYIKVAESQERVDDWWNGLSEADKKNPVNKAKYNSANAALEKAGNFLNGATNRISNSANSTVQYSLDKRPKDMWNFIIGSQFQINRSWMIRAEVGFLGARTQFIGGLQYRFNF